MKYYFEAWYEPYLPNDKAHAKSVEMDDESFLRWLGRRKGQVDPALDVVGGVRDIVNGRKRFLREADVYVEALHLLCGVMGTRMENAAVAPVTPALLRDVEEALRRQRLTDLVSVDQLVFAGPPFDVPTGG